MISQELLRIILSHLKLNVRGIHGVFHWARVLENGRYLSQKNNANIKVVELFTVFHDSCRISNMKDKGHGARGADFARSLRGELFDLNDDDFNLLTEACTFHSLRKHSDNITIQTCWDSDRLDLGRVFMKPDPSYMGQNTGITEEYLLTALSRSISNWQSPIVREEWGLNIKPSADVLGPLKRLILE